MKFMYYLLSYLYVFIMSGSAILIFQKGQIPSLLLFANLFFSLLLGLNPVHPCFLLLGLLGLFITAILNGFALNGEINLSHLFIRFLFSILLIFFYYYTKTVS